MKGPDHSIHVLTTPFPFDGDRNEVISVQQEVWPFPIRSSRLSVQKLW